MNALSRSLCPTPQNHKENIILLKDKATFSCYLSEGKN